MVWTVALARAQRAYRRGTATPPIFSRFSLFARAGAVWFHSCCCFWSKCALSRRLAAVYVFIILDAWFSLAFNTCHHCSGKSIRLMAPILLHMLVILLYRGVNQGTVTIPHLLRAAGCCVIPCRRFIMVYVDLWAVLLLDDVTFTRRWWYLTLVISVGRTNVIVAAVGGRARCGFPQPDFWINFSPFSRCCCCRRRRRKRRPGAMPSSPLLILCVHQGSFGCARRRPVPRGR